MFNKSIPPQNGVYIFLKKKKKYTPILVIIPLYAQKSVLIPRVICDNYYWARGMLHRLLNNTESVYILQHTKDDENTFERLSIDFIQTPLWFWLTRIEMCKNTVNINSIISIYLLYCFCIQHYKMFTKLFE